MAKLVKGVNDFATVNSELVKYFVDKEIPYNYSYGSSKKAELECDNCGYRKITSLDKLSTYGFSCPKCRPGISFPERVFMAILNINKINYKKEYSPKFINPKRYDFYLTDYNIIVEVHGRPHYEYSEFGTYEFQRENDMYKYDLAVINGYEHNKNYFIIDARKNDTEYIVNNILKSKLIDILSLERDIDINYINKIASEKDVNNTKRKVCEYWNANKPLNHFLSTQDVSEVFNLHKTTIHRYLKFGNSVGWCEYDPIKEISLPGKKGASKKHKRVSIYKNGELLGTFESVKSLSEKSIELFGELLRAGNISTAAKKYEYGKTYKGYMFQYEESKE